MRNSRIGFLALFILLGSFLPSSVFAKEIEILSYQEFENRIKSDEEGTVVYNFWATWCKPCVEELPYFEKLNAENEDVRVVFVSLDFKSQYKRKLVPFVAEHNLQAEVLLLDAPDYNAWLGKISKKWSGAIPATLIVDNKNKRWDFYEKSFTYEELTEAINQ